MYFHQQKSNNKNVNTIIFWFFVLFTLFSPALFAGDVADIEQKLNIIIKYRLAAPTKAEKLIRQYNHEVSQLPVEKQLEWHYNTIVVSNQLDDIQLAYESFDAMGEIFANKHGEEYKRTYLNYLGHFAMKGRHNSAAFQYYLCAVDNIVEARHLFSPIYSMASIMMFAGDYSHVRELLVRLRDLAIRHKKDLWSVEIDNTLGVIALYEEQFALAVQYFQRAMDQHHTSGNRNGETITSINLLLALLLAEDIKQFPGVKARVKRLINLQNNKDLDAFLLWLELLEEHLMIGVYDTDKYQQAVASLTEMNNAMVAQPVYDFILPKLNANEKLVTPEKAPLKTGNSLTVAKLNNFAQKASCSTSAQQASYSVHVKKLIEKINKL